MPLSIRQRVQKHREKLKQSGLRPVQIWVPDTRKEDFAEECRRQSLMIADDSQEKEILDWIEDVSDVRGWKK
ncbi:antitoxin MazE family protein [Desulfonatronovibrio magnus]|uniref:antitoxin MazE family protein n=1 Tax=Desulfonatronovibrio magnus TaxID=698827 RepID=UPI0005EBE410|nr:antitoxin MazE family protein [Desulfonatronovibrio magnus]